MMFFNWITQAYGKVRLGHLKFESACPVK